MVTYFVFEVRLSGLHSVDADVEAGVGWGDDIGRVSIHLWHTVLRLGVGGSVGIRDDDGY